MREAPLDCVLPSTFFRGVHASLSFNSPLLIFTTAETVLPPKILFCLWSPLHRRYGNRGHHRTPDAAETVDAGQQGGCIQYDITYVPSQKLLYPRMVLTLSTQLFPQKIATSPNTLRHVTVVEVGDYLRIRSFTRIHG